MFYYLLFDIEVLFVVCSRLRGCFPEDAVSIVSFVLGRKVQIGQSFHLPADWVFDILHKKDARFCIFQLIAG